MATNIALNNTSLVAMTLTLNQIIRYSLEIAAFVPFTNARSATAECLSGTGCGPSCAGRLLYHTRLISLTGASRLRRSLCSALCSCSASLSPALQGINTSLYLPAGNRHREEDPFPGGGCVSHRAHFRSHAGGLGGHSGGHHSSHIAMHSRDHMQCCYDEHNRPATVGADRCSAADILYSSSVVCMFGTCLLYQGGGRQRTTLQLAAISVLFCLCCLMC